MVASRVKLKGGSLSGTYLMTEGDFSFVRKEVSLIENREFGYQRWYSQLKRMQRYSVLFPDVFPHILRFGNHGDIAWFDMNYIENSVTAHEFIVNANSEAEVDSVLATLMSTFDMMHKTRITSSVEGLRFYISEEVERAIDLCLANDTFKQFQSHKKIIFNGREVDPLVKVLDSYIDLAMKNYRNPFETFTHGNSTLENILYVPSTKRLYFIDPYAETIVDSIFGEFSQILQSSNSYYEIFNSMKTDVAGNEISFQKFNVPKLDYFNKKFNGILESRYTESDLIITSIFEISQFTRMLPFKMAVSPDKMIFFYGLSSYLFDELLNKIK